MVVACSGFKRIVPTDFVVVILSRERHAFVVFPPGFSIDVLDQPLRAL